MTSFSPATLTRIVTGLVLATVLFVIYWLLPAVVLSVVIILVGCMILYSEWPALARPCSWLLWPVSLVYVVLPLACALALNHSIYRPLLLWAVFVVALFDSASFFIGKQYGTTPIAPRISPGKTWQGFIAGLCAVVLLCAIASSRSHQIALGALWGIVIATVALLGDLFESSLKRAARLKDSGSLLPGHGGLLDRCDGLLPVIVLVYCAKALLYTLFFHSL